MLSLYKEVLVNLEPPKQSAVTTLRLPSTNSWSLSKDARNAESSSFTEPAFISRHLASEGSIYFRQAQTYPRTFLWRILDDRQTLEIRSADLVKSRHDDHEADRILRLRFPSAIIPTSVAFADAEGQDHVHAFVITEGRELYTLILRSGFFTGPLSGHDEEFFKTSVPSYFTLHRPFRLHANNPYELFITYESGTLQRLTRKAGDDGSQWVQHNFDEKAWSLRGIVQWQGRQSMKFDGRTLDHSTAVAIVALSDSTHAFTVCLNHTLRVWNLTTGHLVLTKDLLDVPRSPQELTAVTLSPAANTSLKLVRLGFSSQTYLVTYSPHNEGYFKFWAVKNSLTSQLELADAFPSASLRVPDPDPSGNSVWSMTGFEVLPTDTNHVVELWVLWRNNNIRQLVSIRLNLMDVERSWNNDWVQTATYRDSADQFVDLAQNDTIDTSSRWLHYLLRPGNYSPTLLETALTIYQDILKFKLTGVEKRASFAQRLGSTVTANVNVRRYAGSEMDYERFDAELDRQWQNFWRIAENLRERQAAPIALAVDPYTNMPWVVMADYCAAIRENNDIEVLSDNHVDLLDNDTLENHWSHRKVAEDDLKKMSSLLKAASSFSQGLSPETLASCQSLLEADFFQNSELPIPTQLVSFYDSCNLGNEITDETYDIVLKHLEIFDGFQGLNSEIFYALLDRFPENVSKPVSQLSSTQIGQEFVSHGAKDIICFEFGVLFGLLLLVVFLECELNADDTQNAEFEGAQLFAQLQIMLREYSKKRWLASNYRSLTAGGSDADFAGEQPHEKHDVRPRSLLHELFVQDIRPQPAVNLPQTSTLTTTIEDVVAWTREHDNVSFEDGLVHIQCELLLNGDLELAKDFLRYQPATAWSTYIKGRLYLACGDADTAASYFRKAAHPLARGKATGDLHESSAGLLSILDAASFHNGLPKYFQHLLALFESSKSYPQAAMFGQLAMQSLPSSLKESDRAVKQDILARLFMAEVKSLRYRSAYLTLSRYTDVTLQRSAMATIIKSMFSSSSGISGTEQSLKLLRSFPIGAHQDLSFVVDKALMDIANYEQFDSNGSPSARLERTIAVLNIIHAYRLENKDYRGAVQALSDQLKLIKELLDARSDEDSVDLRNILLSAINALSCAPADEAYILVYSNATYSARDATEDMDMEDTANGRPAVSKSWPQTVLTLRELRRHYQLLLDRHSRIERGDFDFAMDESSDL